jgi:hypothetical protein
MTTVRIVYGIMVILAHVFTSFFSVPVRCNDLSTLSLCLAMADMSEADLLEITVAYLLQASAEACARNFRENVPPHRLSAMQALVLLGIQAFPILLLSVFDVGTETEHWHYLVSLGCFFIAFAVAT